MRFRRMPCRLFRHLTPHDDPLEHNWSPDQFVSTTEPCAIAHDTSSAFNMTRSRLSPALTSLLPSARLANDSLERADVPGSQALLDEAAVRCSCELLALRVAIDVATAQRFEYLPSSSDPFPSDRSSRSVRSCSTGSCRRGRSRGRQPRSYCEGELRRPHR
jgi:hypothetical protein